MSEFVQLMLVAECTGKAEQRLAAALSQVKVACVLLVPPGWQPIALDAEPVDSPTVDFAALDRTLCSKLVELVQNHDAAALIANDATLAQAIGADGCHLDSSETLTQLYDSTRSFLGRDAIVGVMPGASRHDAMGLAEAHADYVAYPVATGDEEFIHGDAGIALVAWWAEIFESPVVAITSGGLDVCRRVIEAGPPDFIAVPLPEMTGMGALDELALLIAAEGRLPIADKNAK